MKINRLFQCAAMLLTAGSLAMAECVIKADTNLQIVVPDAFPANAGIARHIDNAAKELQTALRETVGVLAPVVKESAKTSATAIYLSNTRAIQALGVNPADFENFNGIILEKDGSLYIAGNDRERLNRSVSNSRYLNYVLGTVKALTVFMEKYMDTRFLLPGRAGRDYARLEAIKVPSNLKEEVIPAFIFATGRHYEMFYDYSNANMGQGGFHSYGGHSYYSAVPGAKYGKEHPEYFVLQAGVRNPAQGHLCISNPDVQELIYQEALRKLDAGAEYVQVAQTDGYVPCECEKCKAYGNTDDFGEKTWILHRSFAERLLKDRPGKKLHIICYPPNFNAPKSFNSFPDNVIIEKCSYSQASFDEWKDIKLKLGFTVYIYNWGEYHTVGITPKTTPEICARQAKHFRANNVRGLYRCGFGELFGMEGPSYYVYGKMLENPELDYNALTEEFIVRAYGAAAAPMRSFFNLFYTRLNLFYTTASYMAREKTANILPKQSLLTLGAIYSPDLLNKLDGYLDLAESLANSEKVRARLALVRKEFEYDKNLGFSIAMYNAYLAKPCTQTFQNLADLILERNALIDSYYDEKGRMFTFKDFGNIPHLGGFAKSMLKVNGRSGGILAAPFTWDVKGLLAKGTLPGIGAKSMTIAKAKGTIGQDPEAGAWANARWQEIGGIQLNETWAKGKFKVIYDDKALYFAFVSDVVPNQKYLLLGKDGDIWNQDCMEVMLDPDAEHIKFKHFMFNPLQNSFYDSQFGYITDMLHPLYHKDDSSWDGKWTYDTKIDGSVWTAFATIPFDTIGATPSSGTKWCMNIGKEAHKPLPPDNKGRVKTENTLMLWSPNMEAMSFINPEAFGNVIFE